MHLTYSTSLKLGSFFRTNSQSRTLLFISVLSFAGLLISGCQGFTGQVSSGPQVESALNGGTPGSDSSSNSSSNSSGAPIRKLGRP